MGLHLFVAATTMDGDKCPEDGHRLCPGKQAEVTFSERVPLGSTLVEVGRN